jgi:hypothetical protein
MQLIPRYLVSNRTNILANEAGFVTEYRPVYTRQITAFTGIDNTLEFKLLNADQKPIDLSLYTIKFQAFDENGSLIIEHEGEQLTSDGSTPIKGLFKVLITENDLLNIKQQFLTYNIHLVDANSNKVVTYVEPNFNGCGTIKIDTCQFPGPRDTYSITSFLQVTEDTPYWASETLNAEPGINGNEALHTAVMYTDSYVGDVIVQATLDNQIIGTTDWADIATVSFIGTETEPTPVNFNGVFSHLRFKSTADPANKISKILVRN